MTNCTTCEYWFQALKECEHPDIEGDDYSYATVREKACCYLYEPNT